MKDRSVILAVDDQPQNIELLEAFLGPAGYRVVPADSGEKALEVLAQELPDLILLDVVMPRMNGFEVLRKLRADPRTQYIPVIMLTALKGIEDRVRAIEAGCDDFLSKPFDKVELLARVRSLVRIKAYHDQLLAYESRLETEVAHKTAKLQRALLEKERAYLETIYSLSRASEYRDDNTGAHILRISLYTRVIAVKIRLKERFTKVLFQAAPMHDVGKIGIPDAVLLKPGKLDLEEWEIMKRHSAIGAKILKGSKVGVIRMAERIALTHHEKWDGSGYPLGLKGDRIPLASRIVAIVDVFDALISERPYKKPFPLEKVFEILKEGEGTHFDPRMVKAFFDSQDEILTIAQQNK